MTAQLFANALPCVDNVTISYTPRYRTVPGHRIPNPNWRYIDPNGHGHYYDPDTTDHYPTLVRVDEGCDDPDHDDDCTGSWHWVCRTCALTINPSTTWAPDREEPVPGMITLTRRVHHDTGSGGPGTATFTYLLTEEQLTSIADAVNQAITTTLDDQLATIDPTEVTYE